ISGDRQKSWAQRDAHFNHRFLPPFPAPLPIPLARHAGRNVPPMVLLAGAPCQVRPPRTSTRDLRTGMLLTLAGPSDNTGTARVSPAHVEQRGVATCVTSVT